MRIISALQGSDQWKAARLLVVNGIRRRPASLAPAMMGVDGNVSRSDMVRMWATGTEREVSDWAERVLFPRGQAVEKLARQMAEARLGEDMFPVTGVDDSGLYLASLDGINDSGKLTLEIKQWNAQKAAYVFAGKCPPCDYPQVAQGLMISGAELCLYVVTDGTPDNYVEMCVVRDPAYDEVLRRGWEQLEEDARNYVHREAEPVVVGVSPESLPALRLHMAGDVALSNLPEFRSRAEAIFGAINLAVADDQGLADAKAAVEYCAETEKRIGEVRAKATMQPESLTQALAEMDAIKEEFPRRVRLALEKEITKYEAARRRNILADGEEVLAMHYANLATRLGIARFPGAAVDFAIAIKGKSSTVKMRDAVATTLAHAKIAANELADRMGENLKVLRESDHASLFPDAEALAVQPPNHVAAVMFGRIAKAKDEADRRAEESRERIRREEEARAQAEVLKAEADRRAEEAREKASLDLLTAPVMPEAQNPVAPEPPERIVPARDSAAIDTARRHRASVEEAIRDALVAAGHLSPVTARKLVDAIAAGKIPNLLINYGG